MAPIGGGAARSAAGGRWGQAGAPVEEMDKNGGPQGQSAPASGLPQALILEHVSPATRLLEKRRQMFEVQEALDAQKEEFGT